MDQVTGCCRSGTFRTEIQLRAMLGATSLLTDSDLANSAATSVTELREWFDLAGFVQAEWFGIISRKPGHDVKVRELWWDVLTCAGRIEHVHCAVCLTGTCMAQLDDGTEPIQIALLAIRSRRRDPAAPNLSTLWAEEVVDVRQMLGDYFDQDL